MRITGVTLMAGTALLSGCAASPGGLLDQPSLQTLTSSKKPGEVAGCIQQALRGGASQGTDGTNYWITRQNSFGPVVRYDFKPAPNGSIVEYRSRLRINNGFDKVQACL